MAAVTVATPRGEVPGHLATRAVSRIRHSCTERGEVSGHIATPPGAGVAGRFAEHGSLHTAAEAVEDPTGK